MTHEHDAFSLLPSEADALVRRLTGGRMRIEANGHGVYLIHADRRGQVHLLPYQLTLPGIEQAVVENDPWQSD